MNARCTRLAGSAMCACVLLLSVKVSFAEDPDAEYRDGRRRYSKQIDFHRPATDAVVPEEKKLPEPPSVSDLFFQDAAPVRLQSAPYVAPRQPAPQKSKSKNWIVPADWSEKPEDTDPTAAGWGWLAEDSLENGETGLINPEAQDETPSDETEEPIEGSLTIRNSGKDAAAEEDGYAPLIEDRPVDLTRRPPPAAEEGKSKNGLPPASQDLAVAGHPEPAEDNPEDSTWSISSADNWGNRSIWDRDQRDQHEEPAMPMTDALLSQISRPAWSSRETPGGLQQYLPNPSPSTTPLPFMTGASPDLPGASPMPSAARESSSLLPPAWSGSRNTGLTGAGGGPDAGGFKALEALKPTESFKPLKD